MASNRNSVIYKKHFNYNNVNKNWNSIKKSKNKKTFQILNIIIKKQLNFIFETFGKKKNKIIFWTKKKSNITTFNNIIKQKIKNKQKLLFLLKKNNQIFIKNNKKKNIIFLAFLEKIFNFNKRFLNIFWKLNNNNYIKHRIKIIKKILRIKSSFSTKKNKKIYNYKLKIINKKKIFKKKIKTIIINKLNIKNILQKTKSFGNENTTKIKIFIMLLKNAKKKRKIFKIKKKKKLKKFNNKKKINKKYKFFINNIKKLQTKKKFFKKKKLKKKSNKAIFKYLNKKNYVKKKVAIKLFQDWNNFYNNLYFNNKKIIKKKKIKIAAYNVKYINKNLLIIVNIYKEKKKKKQSRKKKQDNIFAIFNKKLQNHKIFNKIYKKLNNSLITIKILQNWFKIYKIPVNFKITNYFNQNSKGWFKLNKILRKNFSLEKFSKNNYFENSIFSTLVSFYFKNPESLTNNLTENLKKQWKHRQHLFFTFYVIMAILWQFELKKLTSFKKIKSVYMMIRGKINSGTRTKYFQIKAPYKSSFLTFKNHMNFNKGIAKAKTGVFGIKTWIHY